MRHQHRNVATNRYGGIEITSFPRLSGPEISDLIDHYLVTELSEQTNWHAHSTRMVYRVFIKRRIRPRWGSINIRDVRTIAVEAWLRQFYVKTAKPWRIPAKQKFAIS